MIAYRGRRLDGPLREFHQAVDLLDADTVPESYYLLVMAGRAMASHTPRTSDVEHSGNPDSGGPGVATPGLTSDQLALSIPGPTARQRPRVKAGVAAEGKP